MNWYHCAVLFFCIFFNKLSAQNIEINNVRNNIFYELSFHAGKIVKNWPSEDFPKSKITSISEFKIGFQLNGTKDWHKFYRFPQTGVSLFLGNLGNNVEFGNVVGIVPNMTLMKKYDRTLSFSLNAGMGFAWFNKPYHSVYNQNNILIGSAITNMSIANIQILKSINNNLRFKAGISAFHCSNAHYQVPNVGMNIPSLNIGLQYFPYAFPEIKKNVKSVKQEKDSIRFNLSVGFGIHEFAGTTRPVGGPKYLIPTTSFYLSRVIHHIYNLHVGINLRYYPDFEKYIVNNNLYLKNTNVKSSVATVFLGNDFIIGRFSLLAQGGLNFYNPFYKKYHRILNERDGFSYYAKAFLSSKLGLQYQIYNDKFNCKQILLGTFIKANLGTADFAELSLTYRWR